MLLRPLSFRAKHPQVAGKPVLDIHSPIARYGANVSIDHILQLADYRLHRMKMTIVYKDTAVIEAFPHLIVGVKLMTLHNVELELAGEMQWSLHLWHPENISSEPDRIIGVGSLLMESDKDVRKG
jgi:hypothetical protein